MKAFVVSLNGEPFVTAGVGENGVLTTVLTWVGGSPPRPAEGRLHFHVGGIDSRTGEHVGWSVPEIGVGHEITIKIIETSQVSPEDNRYQFDMSQFRSEKGRIRVIEVNRRTGMGRNRARSGEMSQQPISGEGEPGV